MADKKLDPFKIGDTQRPTVRNTGKSAAAAPPQEEPKSLGFERIERILESDTPENLSKSLNNLLGQLGAMEQTGAMKEKAAAKRAMVAVERTADLLDYLFQTKQALESQGKT